MTREQAINYLFSCGFTQEQVCDVVRALTYEPTTKNDLGVDCISREQALVAIRNLYPSMPRVDFSGSLRKWVDKYKPYIECDDAIKQLPSVTPQSSVPEVTTLAELTTKLTKECEEAYNKGYADGVKSVNICPHCGEYIGEEE